MATSSAPSPRATGAVRTGVSGGATGPPAAPTASEELLAPRKGPPPGVAALQTAYARIPVERIRCFSIIAHIDHGKSTLADRLLEFTGNIHASDVRAGQVLDSLAVERERGITVKAVAASMLHTRMEGGVPVQYLLNLIDTPGHVDFSYEVSRAIAACQGALLLVDASQGVQAQTVANYNAAVGAGLRIVPLLTKIDLPTADPEPCLNAMEAVFGISPEEPLWTSAKSGIGIADVFDAIVTKIAPPGTNALRHAPLRCLLFDSWYDPYRGVVCSVLVVEGVLRAGDVIIASHSGDKFTVQELGLITPSKVMIPAVPDASGATSDGSVVGALGAGHMGYMIAGMKSTKQALVGDTFVHAANPQPALAGFRPAKPMVFASMYPVDTGDFNALATAVDRLTLNDASVSVERESSASLGMGLRCGFLGLLHMDVFHQRLQQEFDTPVIITAPMVAYRLQMFTGEERIVERPSDFPPPHEIQEALEPTVIVSILTPADFVSPLMALLTSRRGVQLDIVYLDAGARRAEASAAMPDVTPTGLAMDGAPAAAAAAQLDESVSEHAAADDRPDDDDDDDSSEDEDQDDADDSDPPTPRAPAPPVRAAVSMTDRVVLKYRVPWAEVVTDLNDSVKSLTAGYASVDWIPGEYQRADIVKVDLLLNSKPVDALSFIAHKEKAVSEGRRVATKLRSVIRRQQFEVVIQAVVSGKVVARERLAPYRKDVLSKSGKTVGGGDKSRKQKLLDKQREGKRRMKTVGNVELSQEAFHSIMTR